MKLTIYKRNAGSRHPMKGFDRKAFFIAPAFIPLNPFYI